MAIGDEREANLYSAILGLRSARSRERRSAAKQLRKLRATSACGALAEALQREIGDPRTWETQYQLLMAIGAGGCNRASSLIWELSRAGKYWSDTRYVYVGAGDAILTLAAQDGRSFESLIAVLDSVKDGVPAEFAEGAMRGVFRERIVYAVNKVETIIASIELINDAGLTNWTALASAGWGGDARSAFLRRCLSSDRRETREAADLSSAGKYKSIAIP